MLRGVLPLLSRSRLRGGRREAKVKVTARGWRVEAKAQVKVEVKVKSSASESHDEACSLSMGTALIQQITLRNNESAKKSGNSIAFSIDTQAPLSYNSPPNRRYGFFNADTLNLERANVYRGGVSSPGKARFQHRRKKIPNR